jgi:hypothetical protein
MQSDTLFIAVVALLLCSVEPVQGQPARLVERAPDPHGSPRPARDARNVPLKTSLYAELALPPEVKTGEADPDSISATLQRDGAEPVTLLLKGRRFPEGVSGWLRPKGDLSGGKSLAVYLEPGTALEPSTRYTVRVSSGRAETGSWSFTTEPPPSVHDVRLALDLKAEPVRWHGRFFSGICNVIFCSQSENYGPTYVLMAEARKQHPRAWDDQRDFWLTGMEDRPPGFFSHKLPNIVRERETRRITKIASAKDSLVLHLEDFFGHEQYGIASDRSVRQDYHAGDEVMVADGEHDARTKVLSADDGSRTVTVAPFASPERVWKIAYEGSLPTKEDPDAPGRFPPGGCYLRKFAPSGTACYYWGRLDKEWDLAHRKYGRRLMVNFADAPGDLARDGRSWTTAKDYVQWHEVAKALAGHVIDRYGEAALGFTWSVFNEPDLQGVFWRADWNELQAFYDYTTDAILRAFEDRGYDSNKVFIGGLELGGIFGTNLRLREFLAHCSPRAEAEGAVPRNAAVTDRRLDGRRSQRVEALCSPHNGKGTPCDFVSIHAYNRSELMAAKLFKAKEEALAIDPDFYRSLWVNSHEACPDWMPPPDEAATDSYLGNGYFPTWCADIVHRQLQRAARDPRFAYGETILTVWPPPDNFAGLNAVTRVIHGEGGNTTVPMPIFHVLGLFSDMGNNYWVLPGQVVGGHTVGGFVSRDEGGTVRVLLFTHHPQDTQSRSEASFEMTLELDGMRPNDRLRYREYRFDSDHNSPFRLARKAPRHAGDGDKADPARLADLTRDLEGSDPAEQRKALADIAKLDAPSRQTLASSVLQLAGQAKDPGVRDEAQAVLRRAFGPTQYTHEEIEAIRELTRCLPAAEVAPTREPSGRVRIQSRVAANGCNILVISRDETAP